MGSVPPRDGTTFGKMQAERSDRGTSTISLTLSEWL
jgi:hypothetical protein